MHYIVWNFEFHYWELSLILLKKHRHRVIFNVQLSKQQARLHVTDQLSSQVHVPKWEHFKSGRGTVVVIYEKIYTKQNNPKPENKIKTNKLFYSYCFYTHHGSQNSSSLECWLLILTISRHNLEKIFPTNSLRKCMEISLENLYVDIEA